MDVSEEIERGETGTPDTQDELKIFATRHAVERFQERVRPGLTLGQCCDELIRLIGVSLLVPLPEWAQAEMKDNTACAELSDGVIALCRYQGNWCKVMTILIRNGQPKKRRLNRRARWRNV